jgi:hypothetical protein
MKTSTQARKVVAAPDYAPIATDLYDAVTVAAFKLVTVGNLLQVHAEGKGDGQGFDLTIAQQLTHEIGEELRASLAAYVKAEGQQS